MNEDREKENTVLSLSGIVEKIIYRNDENGYTVCEISTDAEELCTLVGSMPYLCEGETITAFGNWGTHPSFGRQFQVEAYEKQLPVTETAIEKYLASGAIRGVGKITAGRIVRQFGEETLNVMEHNPDWLTDVPGISPKKAKQIGEAFAAEAGMRNVMMFCRNYFGPITSAKIYKKWGQGAVERIRRNPYLLCGESLGVGFEKADTVAHDLGIAVNAPERIAAGVQFVLQHNASSNGHTFLPSDKLCAVAQKLLSCTENEVEDELEQMISRREVVETTRRKTSCVYLKEYWDAEQFIAAKMDLLDRTNHGQTENNLSAFITTVEMETGLHYAALQKKAISEAVTHGVFLLTGGPGTGKTTVVRAIIRIFQSMGLRIALAAPTGRAAKRMSASAGEEAKTIHRLLEVDFHSEDRLTFHKNENELLEEDVVIVDEASMLDLLLTNALLKAMKPGARLILIGDANQLPPVGAGYVFDDVLKSDRFAAVELTHIFRQAKESLIVVNAHAVNHGESMDMESKDGDFFFLPRATDTETAETIVSLCEKRLPKRYGVSVMDGIQVITPSHKGEAGTDMLNAALQHSINPSSQKKKEKRVRDKIFREGDKVMQIRNNYDIEWEKDGVKGNGIFNGDIGIIRAIRFSEGTMTIDFEDKICEYDDAMLDELELAYAITVHKSQGSEYPIVVMPLYRYTPKLLTRNLLYTAITRAQTMVVLVGDAAVAEAMIQNNKQAKRYTGLRELLETFD